MNWLSRLIERLSPFKFPQREEEEHLRELEQRVRALDAQMGAREDERIKARHKRDQEAYRATR